MRKLFPSSNAPGAGRARLLTSVAALAVVTATPALAQSTVVLPEGATREGNVALDGADRLVVDISRINASTAELNLGEQDGRPALLEGSLESASGDDTLWLRAAGIQTRDIVFTTVNGNSNEQRARAGSFEFTGGIVYEAAGDESILTLRNASRQVTNPVHVLKYSPLRLAGDGTVVIDFSVQADQGDGSVPDQAIVVEKADSQTGDGELDVVIKSKIDGNAGVNAQGDLDANIGLIDVREANSLRFLTGSSATAGLNTLVLGGEADIIIERNAILSLKSPSGQGTHAGRIIRSSGVVTNAGLLDARGDVTPTTPDFVGDRGVGLYLEGARFFNTLTEGQSGFGEVRGGAHAVISASGDNYVHNVGLLSSVNGAAIQSEEGTLVVRNAIHTYANGTTRSGEIDGGGLAGEKIAFQDIGFSRDLIVNSGVIKGDILLGRESDTFLFTEATDGVTGLIDGGGGDLDAYGRSVSASGAVTFSNVLNTDRIINFEMHGLELNGSNLNVTIEAAELLGNGVKVLGAGTVTNKARIGADTGYGMLFEHFDQVAGGVNFVNEQSIRGRYGVLVRSEMNSFTNNASITGVDFGVGINTNQTGQIKPLEFLNTNAISSSGGAPTGGALMATLRAADGAPLDTVLANFRNSGSIRASGASADPTRDAGASGVLLSSDGRGRINFENSGGITADGDGGIAFSANGGQYDIVNSGAIFGNGRASGGVLMRMNRGEAGQVDRFTNTSTGVVRANTGGFAGGHFDQAFAFGVGATGIASGRTVEIQNAGVIEATGERSIAVTAIGIGDVESANFVLVNTGTIRGSGDTVVPAGQYVSDGALGLYSVIGDDDDQRVVAGAIQTWRTTDVIHNAAGATIEGSIDLGLGDDRLENYGTIAGDVRLGDGADTYLLGAGSVLTGRIAGGTGSDRIIVDMNGEADRKIDASQYGGFEHIERLAGTQGSGRLFLNGDFDVSALYISDLTVHIAKGDALSSSVAPTHAGNRLVGGDQTEHVVNDGSIVGGLSLRGGDDRLDNSGSIGWEGISFLTMDEGDDVVTNSGLISTDELDMGDGHDRLENTGRITAIALLGAGNDLLTNAVGGTFENYVDAGDGDDTLTNAGLVGPSKAAGGTVRMGLGDDTLTNLATGRITGDVLMGDGDDEVFNSGVIEGDLDLGDGDDRYEAIGEGKVEGEINGGLGNDTFVFRLQNQTGSIPGGFDGFESFAAYGPGTLQIFLDRNYTNLEILEGANLELTNASNFQVDLIKGDDSSQSVKIDAGFGGSVKLFGGDDSLEMSLGGLLGGDLDGGEGFDTLTLNLTSASSIKDLFGFEAVKVAGASPLTLTGTLGAGQTISFDEADNEFIIAENAVFEGSADGGAGSDRLRVTTGAAASRTIVSGQLTSFESLIAEGAGTLEFSGGTHRFTRFEVAGGNLAFMDGAKLAAGAGNILFTGNADNRFTLGYGSSIGSLVDGGEGDGDVLEFSQGAGQTQKISSLSAENFEILAASGEGQLHIDRDVTFDRVQLEGGNIKVLQEVTLTADVVGGAGNDTFDNAGTVIGDILMGDGDDTYVARTGSFVDGTIDGGVGGNDTVVYSLNDQVGSLLDNIINFESIGVYGPGTLNLDLATDYNSITLMEGANLDLRNAGGSVGRIIGDDSAQTVNIGSALTGGVSLGGGDDTLNLELGGTLSDTLDGGSGNDVLNLTLTSASRINGMANFETANIAGAHALTLGGALGASQRINFDGSDNELIIAESAVFEGVVDGGAGQNLLRIQSGAATSRTVVASQIMNFQDLIAEGSGTLALTGGDYGFDSVRFVGGNLELGAGTVLTSASGVVFDDGDNRLTLGSGAVVNGGVDAGGGVGVDTLVFSQAQGATRIWSAMGMAGFEALETSGAGELRFDVDAAFSHGVRLDGGLMTVAAGTTLTADVSGGEGAETLALLGSVIGDIDLGAGDDRLVIAGDPGLGLRSGGAGSNTLEFRTSGSYAAPLIYNASQYQNFDRLAVSAGVLSMNSDSSWKALSLTGGRLIGQAGTVLTSEETIQVGAGAVFGSAGTVNADIDVRGTLSPGASPGTMTVNGDVAFKAGSNLLLELSPEVSDLLRINGRMTIADGATIDITGVLPSTPGAVLDLVTASEGIEGRFTTINKSETIFGFVSQSGDKLQIRGEFQNDAAYGRNARRSIEYANAVLASGQAVQAFTRAVSVLTDANGVSNAAAFAQLTPEAYGSAMAIGTETALAVADTVRGLEAAAPDAEGVYAFAQALTLDSRAEGPAGAGASRADLRMDGTFGGVGYASGTGVTLGAYVGKTMGEQDLRDLGATTKAEGVMAGAFAGAGAWGLDFNASLAWDRTEGRTWRVMAGMPEMGLGRYDLQTWTADASVSAPVVAGGVTFAPTLGLTWIETDRDAVEEITGGDFALSVEAGRRSGWFADAGIRVSGETALGGRAFRSWFEAGVRGALGDDETGVRGSLSGVDGRSVEVDGVGHDRSVARMATGFSWTVEPSVTFNAGYVGQYGDTARHSVGVGVALKF